MGLPTPKTGSSTLAQVEFCFFILSPNNSLHLRQNVLYVTDLTLQEKFLLWRQLHTKHFYLPYFIFFHGFDLCRNCNSFIPKCSTILHWFPKISEIFLSDSLILLVSSPSTILGTKKREATGFFCFWSPFFILFLLFFRESRSFLDLNLYTNSFSGSTSSSVWMAKRLLVCGKESQTSVTSLVSSHIPQSTPTIILICFLL